MKSPVIILVPLLILWMCASSYWYMCKIKGVCQEPEKTSVTDYKAEVDIPTVKEIENKPKEAVAVVEAENQVLEIEDEPAIKVGNKVVYFSFGKDEFTIDNELSNYFNELKTFLNQNQNKKINLMGHTDNIGDKNANDLLGLKRANYVKKILIEAGVEVGRIQTSSKGEDDPIASNQTVEERDLERRVEIIIN